MQFNSYNYIFYFLPAVVAVYFLTNRLHRTLGKITLLAASLIFYTCFDPSTAAVLGLSLLINGIFAVWIARAGRRIRRWLLWFPVAVNVLLLGYFKYTGFILTNLGTALGREFSFESLIMPLGISFFTFQQIAYVVSVYKEEITRVNLLDYLLYILYFPKILMGPLADPVDMIRQFNDDELKRFRADSLLQGIQIFSFGLFKKVLLADTFSKAVTWGFSHTDAATSMDWILIMLFYTFEIYFDFSGYSDMAVGSSLMLNITLPINFDSPYKALSVRDFWKRWHISLTRFFTKHIYIPLGGSRKGRMITYLNTFLVFLISGIWHGAAWTFILWGVLYGLLMIFDRIFDRLEQTVFEPVRWWITFAVVNVLWLLFRADSIPQWIGILKQILHMNNMNFTDDLAALFALPETVMISNVLRLDSFIAGTRGFWMAAFLLGSFGICLIPENNYRKRSRVTAVTILIAAIAFAWAVLGLGGESLFVYNNF